jgi:hypothetical protein
MEKQNYPDQFLYPGGPPQPPYDLAGWTLPMQMGVTVDRIDKSFKARTEAVTSKIVFRKGKVNGGDNDHYIFSNRDNISALLVNRLQKEGFSIAQLNADYGTYKAGFFIVKNEKAIKEKLENLSRNYGVDFNGLANLDSFDYSDLEKIKVGIYKSWQANMDEGWSRWMLEQFEFDLDTLHNKDIQQGDLSKYSAIIFPSQSPRGILHGHSIQSMPEKFTGGIGLNGMAKIDAYAKQGGSVIFFDSASDLAIEQLGLPVRNVTSGLSPNDFFIPGSLIRTKINTSNPLAFGMMDEVAASFSRSRAFQTVKQRKSGEGGKEDIADAPKYEVYDVATYASENILMSGWALGEERYIKNKSAMAHIPHGKGDIILFGFRPQFRGQPRGTYKLIFNSIYLGAKN